MLKENPKILNFYQSTWKYVLVDEFQDTNSPQFEIVSLLAGKHQNITVVGDDDQSIYGWRGANIDNILPTFRTHSQKTLRLSLKKIIDQHNVFLMELGLLFQTIKTELKRSWKQQEEKEKRFH